MSNTKHNCAFSSCQNAREGTSSAYALDAETSSTHALDAEIEDVRKYLPKGSVSKSILTVPAIA